MHSSIPAVQQAELFSEIVRGLWLHVWPKTSEALAPLRRSLMMTLEEYEYRLRTADLEASLADEKPGVGVDFGAHSGGVYSFIRSVVLDELRRVIVARATGRVV